MQAAALDLGSNTFLCLLFEGSQGVIEKIFSDDVEIVRLGQGIDQTGRFHPDALQRADACLARFRKKIDTMKIEKVIAAATAAARKATNSEQLLEIGKRHGFEIEIISGEEEADLSYRGVSGDFKSNENVLMIDIGGGSTELTIGCGPCILVSQSLPLGGVRQTEKHISSQPISEKEKATLLQDIETVLGVVSTKLMTTHVDRIVAVAGTPTALAAAEIGEFQADKIDGYRITLERLRAWSQVFQNTTIEEKEKKYHLGKRADIIFAGVSILERVLLLFGKKDFYVSTKGLRYGLASKALSQPF